MHMDQAGLANRITSVGYVDNKERMRVGSNVLIRVTRNRKAGLVVVWAVHNY